MRKILKAALIASLSVATAQSAHANSSRPAAFLQCAACHSVEPGRNGIGPSLAAVAGRKAASLSDFNYSPALKNSGLTWDETTLDKWLTSPLTVAHGSRHQNAFHGHFQPCKTSGSHRLSDDIEIASRLKNNKPLHREGP